LDDHYRALDLYQSLGEKKNISTAFHNIGRDLVMLKRYEEAVIPYQKALEYNPDNYWAYRGLTVVYSVEQNEYEVMKGLSSMLQIAPEETVTWYEDNILLFYWLNGNPGFFKQILLSLGVNEENKKVVKQLVDLHGMKIDWFE
jgi:tetratricopeptide (TPR) repeat protein